MPPATNDFIQYWSAYSAMVSGLNPYDQAVLAPIQIEASYGMRGPQDTVMYWSPPWFLLLWSSILSLPYFTAQYTWLFASMGIGAILVLWGASHATSWRGVTLGVLTALIFSPFIDSVGWGQSSPWLAVTVLGILVTMRSRRYLLCGALVPLLTLKPHLFFASLLGYLIASCWQPALRPSKKTVCMLIVGATITTLALVISVAALYPAAMQGWIASLSVHTDSQRTALVRELWMTSTLSTIVRVLIPSLQSYLLPVSVSIVVLGGIAIAFVLNQASTALTTNIATLHSHLAFLMVGLISFITAPYGWHYDLLTIMPLLIAVIAQVPTTYSALLILPIALGRFMLSSYAEQHVLLIVPILLLLTLSILFNKQRA